MRLLTYYGGKERMLPILRAKIPPHKTYVEGMVGGGSLFFDKEPSQVNVINDINGNITNFYIQYKTNFKELNELVQNTLHCEHMYKKARKVYQEGDVHPEVLRAWAVWVLCNMSFGSAMDNGSFQITTNSNDIAHPGTKSFNRRRQFNDKSIMARLERAMILNKDVLDVVEKYNNEDVFIYLDPPYYQANQGPYKGYTEQNFRNLLDKATESKSKILISCYDSELLKEYPFIIEKYEMRLGVKAGGRKVEVLLRNYELKNNLFSGNFE